VVHYPLSVFFLVDVFFVHMLIYLSGLSPWFSFNYPMLQVAVE